MTGRPRLGGVDHVSLTVTDLEVSSTFYTGVLGFVEVMRVPGGRIFMHSQTDLLLAVVRHDDGHRESFSELHPGVDHVGLAASSREELEQWERHFDRHGVPYTPVRDEVFGSHLNFRDPDNIALELTTSNELMLEARGAFASGRATPEVIAAFVAEHVGPEFAPSPGA